MPKSFTALGIRAALAEALAKQGLTAPTPVQEQTIPAALEGQDIMAQAQTGTGKTLAFVLPVLERIHTGKDQVQALIVTPTRELAIQITDEIRKLADAAGVRVLAAYGGQDVEGQIRKLHQAPHIIVATPGRLLDHIRRETVAIHTVSALVLDEADQMLDMGFLPEVEEIIRHTPRQRQTMLFSATLSDAVRRLAVHYTRNAADIRIKGRQVTLEGIRQLAVETTDRGKQAVLLQLIDTYRPYLAVVFCRTKIRAKKLTEALQDKGLEADELHGDLTQAKREQVMKRFRAARLQILVATDVAARGLDVEGVTHVFNYDIPADAEAYIHRIGRTGRAGQKGMAVTLTTPRDRMTLQHIERGIGAVLEKRRIGGDSGLESQADRKPARTAGGRGAGRGRTPGNAERGTDRSRRSEGGPRSAGNGGGEDRRRRKSAGPEPQAGGERSVSGPRRDLGAEARGEAGGRRNSRGGPGSSGSGKGSSRSTDRNNQGRTGGRSGGRTGGRRGGRS